MRIKEQKKRADRDCFICQCIASLGDMIAVGVVDCTTFTRH